MAKVIFMHFDKDTDGLYDAKIGEPIVRLAKEKRIPIGFECQEGNCGSCLVTVEHISNKEPTSYMEDFELDKLVELGAITAKEASHCQQFTISPRVRLACQMLVKGDVLIRPYRG